jgi:hypothetical protein
MQEQTAIRLAADIIFNTRPELYKQVDWAYLSREDSRLKALRLKLSS